MTMKEATTFATAKLLAVAVAMFAFGFALVPLYEIYCQVTGANGKTGDQYQATEQLVIDESREVTVQFLANNNANMPWQFRPSVRTMKAVPGKMYETTFFAGNITRDSMVGQAVPSVAPFHAASISTKQNVSVSNSKNWLAAIKLTCHCGSLSIPNCQTR